MRDERKIVSTVGGIFMVIGIIMVVVSIIITASQVSFLKKAKKTEAYIEQIDKHKVRKKSIDRKNRNKTEYSYDVYVSYEVDGVPYDFVELGYHSTGMKVGQSITIYYNPEDPTSIKTKGAAYLFIFIPWLLAVFFTVFGGVMLVANRRLSRRRW